MKKLIQKYKNKIAALQRKRNYYESLGKGGACIAVTGEIQAYNAVILDLQKHEP